MSSDDGTTPAAGEQPAGTSKVARKRAAAKKSAAPAPSDQGGNRAPAAGPPLPGEAGYDDQPTEPVDGGEVGNSATRDAEQSGEAAPPSTTSDSPGSDAVDDAPEPSSPDVGADPGDQAAGSGEATGDVPAADDPGPAGERPSPRPLSRAQQRMIMSLFGGLGIAGDTDRGERLLVTSSLAGREVESTNDLTVTEAKAVIDSLSRIEGSRDKLNVLLDTIDEANAQRAAAEAGDES